jgi:hypothetical protein
MRVLLIGILTCAAAVLAHAASIEVDFVGAGIPTGPGSTVTIDAALPGLMGGASDATVGNYVGDTLFLKFKIPDTSELSNIDSFTVSVSLYDNGDGGGESAQIDFAQPLTNIVLADPAFTTLNHITSSSPEIFTYTLTPAQITQVLPTITDGNFRIRIMRETGDFEVAGASAAIDVTPEPSSLPLGICAVACFVCLLPRMLRRA